MLQPKLRNRAMEYMKRRLEPIVYQVSRSSWNCAVITVWHVHKTRERACSCLAGALP